MSILTQRIAGNIAKERKAKGLSQGALAKIMRVDRSYISSLEKGTRNPSLKTLEKVAAALSVPIDTLLVDTGKNLSSRSGLPFVPGLLKAKIPSWKGRLWYHQRFDGSPYLLALIADAQIETDIARKDGMHFTANYCFFENGGADWYISMDDIERVSKHLIELAKKKKHVSSELIRKWDKSEKSFYEMCERLKKTDLHALSDDELLRLHDECVGIAHQRNSSSSVIDGFALGTDTLIAQKVKDRYDVSPLKSSVPFSEVFSVLTTPVRLSFLAEAERELHKTVMAIKEDPTLKKKLIQEYRDRYFWIKNNYIDSHDLPVYFFEEEIARIQSSSIDSVQEVRKLDVSVPALKKKAQEYAAALALDAHTLTLLEITRDFATWQDDRKKSTLFSAHYFLKILAEVAQRVNVPLDLLKFESPDRIHAYFESPQDTARLKAIREQSVYYWDEDGQDVAYGKDAALVKHAILPKDAIEDVADFRGLTASPGKATGRVRIIKSVKEIATMQKGEVLVTVMTRPDYVPAMKKAVAIVTNEGGITSHAAIVSRELKIPCIIGTKIATEVLKDGELVEVNANHGVVRRLGAAR